MRRGIISYLIIFGLTILIREIIMVAYAFENPDWIDSESFEAYDSEA